MYSILYFVFFITFLCFFCYNIYLYVYLNSPEREGLVSKSDENTIPGKELIDETLVYKVISSERQDNEKNYADIPENGQAIKFSTNDDQLYLINPITEKPFYINNNHMTIKVKSIKKNTFPEHSLCIDVVSKCIGCEVVTHWEMYVLPIRKVKSPESPAEE